MLNSSSLKKFWLNLEKKKYPPKYVKKVNLIEFESLRSLINKKSEFQVKNIIKKIYSGEAFIVRNAAKKNLKKTIIQLAKYYDRNQRQSFHKMLDGTPNFHRIIDKNITKKYSLYAIKHSYYFYNWNIKSKLEKQFKRGAYRHWRYIKFLAGNNRFEFEKNIPSQNQIDRLQIVNYPLGGGQLRDHVDPRTNQRIVTGLIMSKKGIDFQSGGFYFRSKNKKKINIEDKLEIGDAVIFYGSLVHGVDAVDKNKKINWKSYDGRWFVGMFVNDSDHVKNRITAKDLTNSTNYKRKAS